MQITRKSQLRGIIRTMEINIGTRQLERYMEGEFIQRVAPELTPDEREFILTGITAEEWDSMMGDVDEEDAVEATPLDINEVKDVLKETFGDLIEIDPEFEVQDWPPKPGEQSARVSFQEITKLMAPKDENGLPI